MSCARSFLPPGRGSGNGGGAPRLRLKAAYPQFSQGSFHADWKPSVCHPEMITPMSPPKVARNQSI
eukprot:8676531-Pyramimonas_sp.AAC.1